MRAGRLLDAALGVGAGLGVLTAALLLAGWLLGCSLVIVKTGSMDPAMPRGSLALVRAVDATAVAPGDVVTVDRPGRLPVTHRVVAPEPAGDGGVVELTLQGDANPRADADRHQVERVRIVVASVPGLGFVVARLQHPAALAITAVAAAAVVTLALWPRDPGSVAVEAPE